jgi:hypothetical protein
MPDLPLLLLSIFQVCPSKHSFLYEGFYIKDHCLVSQQEKIVDKISSTLDTEIQARQKVFAAIFVQRAFRRKLMLRKPKMFYKTLSFLIPPSFEECLREVDRIAWPDRRYRLIFLGLLPHVLVCLDAIVINLEHMKAEAAKLLTTAHHRDLSKRGRAVTAIQ